MQPRALAILLIIYQSFQLGAISKVLQWLLLCSCFYSALCLLCSGHEGEDSVLAGLCLLRGAQQPSGTALQATQNWTHHRETQEGGQTYN